MPSARDLTPDKRFLGLFVGRSGSGKTVAACSFPKPLDVIDFDGRIRGILGAPWIERDKIQYDYYPPKMPSLIETLDKKLEVYNALFKSGQQLPQTLVMDSLTNECFAMLAQSMPLTHAAGKGKKIGSLVVAGPEDYGFEATATYNILAFLKSIPITNIIVTAHIIERFGKADPSNPYSESVPIGEKLSVRDKIGENAQTHFDHVFRFERRMIGNEIKFYVRFWSDLARSAFPNLPTGDIDITGKDFYQTVQSLTNREATTSTVQTIR